MISYKIDKQAHAQASGEIKDMTAVLAEIAPTLQALYDVMRAHEATISSPSIDSFRSELQQMIVEATMLTRAISEKSQKLVVVSDQAGKHLASIEDHFGAALRIPVNEINETQAVAA